MSCLLAAALLAAAAAPLWGAVRTDPGLVLGANMSTWWQDGYSTPGSRESLRRLAATGASWVALTPTLYVAGRTASDVLATPNTVSDGSLRGMIRAAHGLGLKVLLKPHVDLPDSYPRWVINPDDPQRWFKSYEGHMRRYAALARQERCEMFAVGTELAMISHPGHRRRWLSVIDAARAEYPGPLTYAANGHAFAVASFWDRLDYIGVDAYFPVPGGRDVAALRANWRPWILSIGAVAAIYDKPVIFTEVGLASQKGANLQPWKWGNFDELDLEGQAAYYQAMFEAASGESWFRGFLAWHWSVDPSWGVVDKSHNVQGKPAQAVLEAAFRRARAPAPAVPSGLLERLRELSRRLSGLPRGGPF